MIVVVVVFYQILQFMCRNIIVFLLRFTCALGFNVSIINKFSLLVLHVRGLNSCKGTCVLV